MSDGPAEDRLYLLVWASLEHFGVPIKSRGIPKNRLSWNLNCMLERGGQRAWLNTFPLILASG